MKQKSDLLQKEAFFYGLFESSRIGQAVLDDQYRLVLANKQMYEFFNLESSHTEGMLFGEVFHCSNFGVSCSGGCEGDNKQCNLMHAISIVEKGGIIDNNTIPFSFKRDSCEETKWFQLNGSSVSYCDQGYFLLIFVDITELKQREKRLKELLSLDLATGTANKHGLIKSIKRRMRTGGGQQYCLCMIDFDNFKQLNDKYGHLFGDTVLEKFSDIAHRHMRKEDVLGRYGGDEFVFIFDGNDETQAFQVLKCIHAELTQYFSKIVKQPVTFSAGIIAVDCSFPASFYNELLAQADSLLYESKKLGRARAMGRQECRFF